MSHTKTAEGGTLFIYNGDYSGNVIIAEDSEGIPRREVTVPFTDLRELVYAYLRARKIQQLEDYSDAAFEAALLGGACEEGR